MNSRFGIYIHWPFCQAKCPYCDFNSHVSNSVDFEAWERAFLSELDRVARETPNRILESVFFGGGTPSLMPPKLVHSILDRIARNWRLINAPEITLEANPTSIEKQKFRAFREAGVNRISMGMQALNDTDLRKLGRLHSAKEAISAYDVSRETFDRVSFDLIYARQDQSLDDWEKELKQALTLASDHISLYQLTIEPNTAFGQRYDRGLLHGLPDEDLSAEMYDLTQDLCEAAHMPAYEVSNHAKAGAESRHNMIYWQGGDYLGLGPGAHGRVTLEGIRYATTTPLMPNEWLEKVSNECSGEAKRTALPKEEQAIEYLLMSLRLVEGTDLSFLKNLGLEPNENKLAELKELGLIEVTEAKLKTTKAGRLVTNGILRELLI